MATDAQTATQTDLPSREVKLRAFAADFDGTLAHDGIVPEATLIALARLKHEGFQLILVTGRELNQLISIFPEVAWFDRIVAENGGVLYRPADRSIELLTTAPPAEFSKALLEHGVPLEIGLVIVATIEPHETVVLEEIKKLGLELQVIFNKGAVMVLPTGVNKATGLQAALVELQLMPAEVAGVGDAENDHAFLEICGLSVAVANALPAIKEKVDYVTASPRGEGVVELIDRLIPPPVT